MSGIEDRQRVDAYRDGSLSSTDLVHDAMERGGTVEKGHAKDVAWHADDETMNAAYARMHDEANPSTWIRDATSMASPPHAQSTREQASALIEKAKDIASDPAKAVAEQAKHMLAGTPRKMIKKQARDEALEGALGPEFVAGRAAAKAAARGSLVPTLAVGALATTALTAHALKQCDELTQKNNRDGMSMTVLTLCKFDPSFQNAEFKKYDGMSAGPTWSVFKNESTNELTAYGKIHQPELQAAVDAGSQSGIDAHTWPGGKEAYFASHPNEAARAQSDVAFSLGFQQVDHVAKQPDAAAKLDALRADLASRVAAPAAIMVHA